MFHFNNLNHYEFEELCCDIATKKLGIPVRMFAQGTDGGVDIRDSSSNNEIVIQVKHHKNPSNLYLGLEKELKNVKVLKPKKYYVMTSIPLSSEMRKKIRGLFIEYMEDEDSIIDGIDINKVLQNDLDIVKKNFKLWLYSENIYEIITNKDIYIDSEQIQSELVNLSKLYVKTKHYDTGLKMLLDSHILVITGEPASGKTILSKMLLLYFISQGFKVRHSSSNNIDSIKKTLSMEPLAKEIILLDDVLGQTALDINTSNAANLMHFIRLISSSSNKYLIMNSRITIFNQMKHENQKFEMLMDDHLLSINFMNIKEFSIIEKAKILYNHLLGNLVPRDYIDEIVKEKKYHRIIKHKNYNPRIIQMMTKPSKINQLSPTVYYDKFLNSLDNDELIWNDEFNGFTKQDKLFVLALYSESVVNGHRVVNKNKLGEIFYSFLDAMNVTFLENDFDSCTEKLNTSIIKLVLINEAINFAFANPSFVDYFNRKFIAHQGYQSLALSRLTRIQGLSYFSKNDKNKKFLVNLIMKGELNKLLISETYEEYVLILNIVIKMEIFTIEIKDLLHSAIKTFITDPIRKRNDIIDCLGVEISKIYSDKFVKFYSLEQIDIDTVMLKKILERTNTRNFPQVCNELYEIIKKQAKPFHIFDSLTEQLRKNIRDIVDDFLYGELLSKCSDVVKETYDHETITEDIYRYLDSMLEDYVNDLNEDLFDINEFSYSYDVLEALNNETEYQDALFDKYGSDQQEDRYFEEKENEHINSIFIETIEDE